MIRTVGFLTHLTVIMQSCKWHIIMYPVSYHNNHISLPSYSYLFSLEPCLIDGLFIYKGHVWAMILSANKTKQIKGDISFLYHNPKEKIVSDIITCITWLYKKSHVNFMHDISGLNITLLFQLGFECNKSCHKRFSKYLLDRGQER